MGLSLLILFLLQQPQVFPGHPGRPARAVVVGDVGAATGETEAGFNMRIAKELKKHCPGVKVVSERKDADYTVLFNEGLKYDITVIKGTEVIHASSSSWSIKSVVKDACKAIDEDWQKKSEKKEERKD